jgi:hypothetical protein
LHESLKTRTRAATRSTYKTAVDLYLAENGDVWPTTACVQAFGHFGRLKFALPYANAQLRVIREWKKWLEDNSLWSESDPGLSASATSGKETVPSEEACDERPGAVTVRLDRQSLQELTDVVRETIFGGEPSQDYWSTVLRRVSGSIGTDGVSKLFQLDALSTERLLKTRRVPRHLYRELEHMHALLILRKSGVDPDDLTEQLEAVTAYMRP